MRLSGSSTAACLFVLAVSNVAPAIEPGVSPYGPGDDVGLLQGISDSDRLNVLKSIANGRIYDLSVEFFMGMPGPDSHDKTMPPFLHFYPVTPAAQSREIGSYFEHAAPKGVGAVEDAITMTLHHGTQIDAFAHVNYDGRIFNGFHEDQYFGLEGWTRGGAERIPPIVGRGILIDVAAMKELDKLPPSYSVTIDDLKSSLALQKTEIGKNTIVFIRTGVMNSWPENDIYHANAGLTVSSAAWLVDQGAVLIGADNSSVDRTPLLDQSVHGLLLVERGVNMIEQLWLNELSRDNVYEFAVIALPLKIRGGAGSPIRVIAFPL